MNRIHENYESCILHSSEALVARALWNDHSILVRDGGLVDD
jgi:hypothetical protein